MNRQTGFSMIEVLVTLLLVAIGVLGMVALQGRTIAYTQDSVQRNTAAMLANDLIELMRATPTGFPASSGFYKSRSSGFPTPPDSCTPLPNDAAGQLACWAAKVGESLPGVTDDLLKAEYYVCRTATANSCTGNGTAVEIQIAWQVKAGECMDETDTGGDSDKTICRYRLRSRI